MSDENVIESPSEIEPSIPGYLSLKATAARLGLSEGTLYSYRSRGRGPRAVRVRGVLWYEEASVEAWRDGTGSAHLKQHPTSKSEG